MFNEIPLENILFLDIETVPAQKKYSELTGPMKALWEKKAKYIVSGEETAEEVYSRAGIYAEFGKIICISLGFVATKDGVRIFRLKSFYGKDEKELLEGFVSLMKKHYNSSKYYLCAHNGKEFDFPYIARRCLLNRIKLPEVLNIAGKKPWEVKHLDTLELWKFGDYKHYTSLNLLTQIFNIPTPKDDISGADVARVFYVDDDVGRIVRYCEKDVLAVAQLFLAYKCEDIIPPQNVISTTFKGEK